MPGWSQLLKSGENPSWHKQQSNSPHVLLWLFFRLSMTFILWRVVLARRPICLHSALNRSKQLRKRFRNASKTYLLASTGRCGITVSHLSYPERYLNWIEKLYVYKPQLNKFYLQIYHKRNWWNGVLSMFEFNPIGNTAPIDNHSGNCDFFMDVNLKYLWLTLAYINE